MSIFKLDEVVSKINDIDFLPPQKNEKVLTQLISTPKLDGRLIDIELPLIKLQEVILQNLSKLIPEDKKETEIKFQDIIKEYENKKKEITEYSLRVRLNLDIHDLKNEIYDVKTSIWKKENKSSPPTQVEIKTVDDVEKYIKYGSDIKMIIRPNKLYINTKNEGSKKEPIYKMGLTFKIIQVCVMGNSNNYNTIDYKHNYAFNEDDEDDDESKNHNGPTINTNELDNALDDVLGEGDDEDDN